jgi:hypothetical protein
MASIISPTFIPRAPKRTAQENNDLLQARLDERDRTAELMQRLGNEAPAAQAARAGQTMFREPGGGTGYGGGSRSRGSQGGGGGPTFGFAPTNFRNGSRYNAEGYRADGRRRIEGFSRKAAGLPDYGGLNEFYANQEGTRGDRTNPAFYQGSEDNNQPPTSPEIAGQLDKKNETLVPFAGGIVRTNKPNAGNFDEGGFLRAGEALVADPMAEQMPAVAIVAHELAPPSQATSAVANLFAQTMSSGSTNAGPQRLPGARGFRLTSSGWMRCQKKPRCWWI